ncbi:TPA: hypothetical protein ACTW83_000668 [Klebsiella michiganensis]
MQNTAKPVVAPILPVAAGVGIADENGGDIPGVFEPSLVGSRFVIQYMTNCHNDEIFVPGFVFRVAGRNKRNAPSFRLKIINGVLVSSIFSRFLMSSQQK